MTDSRVLVDAATKDDAAVFRLSEDRALVATVDFFTPIVDDAYSFGAIAAANALSDLYAMGATPFLALNLVAWPRDPILLDLLGETLRGGADVLTRAGALLLGGHSIDDEEPKYGVVALGEVRPDQLITNAGVRPGDALVLTKPIGTGILSTALKRDLISEAEISPAVELMTTLNADAMSAMLECGEAVHAATDVTGFGLVGHLHSMLEASECAASLTESAIPVMDHVRQLAARNAVPGGTQRNLEAAAAYVEWGDTDPSGRIVLCDAQTSGGLLIAVAPEERIRLDAALTKRNVPSHLIGTAQKGDAGHLTVVASSA